MTDEEETESMLESLTSPDPDERMYASLVLADDPTGDARVRAVLETLLDDRSRCPAPPPAIHAEVRWYAAFALAAERQAAGIVEAVHVLGVVPPVDVSTLADLAKEAYGDERGSATQLFDRLQADGKLPTRNLIL